MEKRISWKNAVEYGGILVGAFLTVKYPATVYVLFLILWGDSEFVTSAISEE